MTKHPPETKAAVLAALLTGQGVNAVAREYQIPQRTVSHWNEQARALVSQGLGSEKTELEIGDGLSEYVRTALRTLVVQLEHVADTAWLRDQTAADLAVLHGVLVDKVIRLLEAAEAGRASAAVIDLEPLPADAAAAGVP